MKKYFKKHILDLEIMLKNENNEAYKQIIRNCLISANSYLDKKENIMFTESISIINNIQPRIINYQKQVGICKNCNSSMIRKYAFCFWMKPFCINKKCKNKKIRKQ